MDERPLRWAVTLDGGTTNTRARLLCGERVVATVRRAIGVRDHVLGSPGPSLAASVRDCLLELRNAGSGPIDRIVAAGMLASEVGLTAVPHVVAPAGLDELAQGVVARRIPEITTEPLEFVPGVRTPPSAGPDGWMAADVMRGEECETLGAWLALGGSAGSPPAGQHAPGYLFLWPGSHTKLVRVDPSGRIMSSYTTLAGELMMAVARHTLLAASLPENWTDAPDPSAVAAGVRAVSEGGLGRAAFLVRIAALTGTLAPAERAAFWLGAVTADDAGHLAACRLIEPDMPIWVGGRQPQRALYAAALAARLSNPVQALGDELAEAASARGALAVALRHADLGGSLSSG